MKIIGRENEIKLLKYTLNSHKSELIAVYGRRRVGKTFLIREAYKKELILEISGLYKSPLSDQLDNFDRLLNLKSKKNSPASKTWLEAFYKLEIYLDSLKSSKKKVIFIDEFPWLASPKSRFLTAFENFWNNYITKRDDMLVVICGSAASYMVQKIIKNKGGLHNRITQKIRLLPFTLHETELFLKSKNIRLTHYDIIQLYMAIGGIPHYLEKIRPGMSVVQNIDSLCFDKDGILADEFEIVFASLFSNAEKHTKIVRALSTSRKGLTRKKILEKCALNSSGDFTEILGELIESGFVSQYLNFGKKKKDTIFRLSDEYSIFYLKYIENNKGKGTWLKIFNSKSHTAWCGFSFETLCLKHIEQIKYGLGVDVIYSESSSWHNDNAQIDLLIDRDDNIINICELKFTTSPFTITKQYAENLRNKTTQFQLTSKTNKTIMTTMITTYGVVMNNYKLELIQSDLTMDSLFEM